MKVVIGKKDIYASLRVYDKKCIGNQTNNTDIMITLQIGKSSDERKVEFYDVFMSNKEAKVFSDELLKQLASDFSISSDECKEER